MYNCLTLRHVKYSTSAMFVRCWVICVFLHLVDKVSLQDLIEKYGVVGGSVILPCLYEERELKPEEINVFWRYNESQVVYDIEKGSVSTKNQDVLFKDRLEIVYPKYGNKDFSIRLSHLKFTDNGEFSCFIPVVKKKYKLTLQVKETAPEPTVSPRNSSVKAQPAWIETLIISVALYFAILCC